MSDISRIKLNGTEYTLKDPVARGEEEETEGISHLTVDGTVYDCKDIVARGEGEPNAREISKVSVGGKVYQIKDEVARADVPVYDCYFCVYSTDDDSLTFYGDSAKPAVGSQYKGKTVSGVYDFEDTPQGDYPDFNDDWYGSMKSVYADPSASGARPKSCYSWFDSCGNLESVDLGNLNTSNVTNMGNMFIACSNLTTLDVSGFDTSNVTNMGSVFNGCSNLTTLDVSGFDTSNVTNMGSMFNSCSSLTTIYSDDDKFVTTAVTSGISMFLNCTKLVGGNGTVYDSNNYGYEMAHIDKPDNPGYFTDIAAK